MSSAAAAAAARVENSAPRSERARVLEEIAAGAWEALDAEEILTRAVAHFHPKLALSCSFGNPEGLVLLHMLHGIEPRARVYTLDTGRMPQETHDLMDRVRERYDLTLEVLMPEAAPVTAMVREHGMNLFYESLEKRRLCCGLRKVEPNRRYLATLDAYLTGLRREQGVTRSTTRKAELEDGGRLVKLNPLADWSRERVMRFVREHGVPVNRLHARGYPSVGCAPCTRAVPAGADPRSGRWWWEREETRECGIHTDEEGDGSGI